MVNDWIQRHRQSVSLLSVVLVLSALLAIPAAAATLKDIRVGEFYEASKRVVLEFDHQPEVEAIKIVPPGNLQIVMADVHPGFIRKIPIDNIDKLNNILISEKNGKLIIDLFFNLTFQRYKSNWFDTPSRLVVDVFFPEIINNQLSFQTKSVETSPIDTTNGTLLSATPNMGKDPLPPSILAEKEHLPSTVSTESHNDIDILTRKVQPPIQESDKDQPSTSTIDETDLAIGKQSDISRSMSRNSQEKTSKGLQHYLLIGLVALTIVILFMLIAMMFPKSKFREEKKPLKIDDLLHRQEEHIASLNSQIEEQLKRYNEL